jgi:hypothetical protein
MRHKITFLRVAQHPLNMYSLRPCLIDAGMHACSTKPASVLRRLNKDRGSQRVHIKHKGTSIYDEHIRLMS